MAALELLLVRAAACVPKPTSAQLEILGRLNGLRARLDEGLLRVAVLGQFKRGKSTLLNALLGAPVLPTGVTPVTAIPTFIRSGPKASVRIGFKNGKETLLASVEGEIPGVLAQYVSESGNPRNRLDVESVALEIRSEFLDQGIVLIDTPGVGSTFLHNTQAAESVLVECDAAIFVISVDPPITEVEVDYLAKAQGLIPKIFFALNKIDLVNSDERGVAERFLAGVLHEQVNIAQPIRIFGVSARRGLEAKQHGDSQALALSGVQHLEQALARELAREKRAIAFATGRRRAISLVGEMLFQSELERKALLMPEEVLRQKAAIFESSVARIESERQALSDFLLVDRKRLLSEIETETNRLWSEVQGEMRRLVGEITAQPFEDREARTQVAKALAGYFERSHRNTVEIFRAKLGERLSVHRQRAGALISLVRRTAADLMDISVASSTSEDPFELKREPYWVAPIPSISLLDISAGALAQFLPGGMRNARTRRQLGANAEKAALHNLANLDWAIRQNIEDAFRRFEFLLAERLDRAVQATRQAMQIASERRNSRAVEMDERNGESERSIAALSDVLMELQVVGSDTI